MPRWYSISISFKYLGLFLKCLADIVFRSVLNIWDSVFKMPRWYSISISFKYWGLFSKFPADLVFRSVLETEFREWRLAGPDLRNAVKRHSPPSASLILFSRGHRDKHTRRFKRSRGLRRTGERDPRKAAWPGAVTMNRDYGRPGLNQSPWL